MFVFTAWSSIASETKQQLSYLTTGCFLIFQESIRLSSLVDEVVTALKLLKNRLLTEDMNGMNWYRKAEDAEFE